MNFLPIFPPQIMGRPNGTNQYYISPAKPIDGLFVSLFAFCRIFRKSTNDAIDIYSLGFAIVEIIGRFNSDLLAAFITSISNRRDSGTPGQAILSFGHPG